MIVSSITLTKNFETFEELQSMMHSMFMKKIRSQIMKKALEYLLEKIRSKGKDIKYQKLAIFTTLEYKC